MVVASSKCTKLSLLLSLLSSKGTVDYKQFLPMSMQLEESTHSKEPIMNDAAALLP